MPSARGALSLEAVTLNPMLLASFLPLNGFLIPPFEFPPLLRFVIELFQFPQKIDRIIARVQSWNELDMPMVNPADAPKFPKLRKLKRLVLEAQEAFLKGDKATAKSKLEEAARELMPPNALDEISDDSHPLVAGNPNGPTQEQILRDDIRAEIGFMETYARENL